MSEVRQLETSAGTIQYQDEGVGDPILFVHGLLTNNQLWRKVIPELREELRCIAPTWPLGSHSQPMSPSADLSPAGIARLIVEVTDGLGLERVTLVGNDTGGAICQLVATEYPDRISRLVLTSCDCFDNFFPPVFRYMQLSARIPGLFSVLLQAMRLPLFWRLPTSFGWLAKRPIPKEVVRTYLRPALSDKNIRRDTVKFLQKVSSRYTLEAAGKLRQFQSPTLVLWAQEDRLFPVRDGRKLTELIPNAEFELVPDSYTFISEDRPKELATSLARFMRSSA